MKTAIHWYRKDLRIADNMALYHACKENDVVWPVFIFDDRILKAPQTGAPCVAFMLECLQSLQKNIEAMGGRLIIRHGNPEEELFRLAQEVGASSIYFNRDYEPFARKRDGEVERIGREKQIAVHSYRDDVIHEPHEILKPDGTPYAIFTPYSKMWRSLSEESPVPVAKWKTPLSSKIFSEPIPSLAKLGFKLEATLPAAGERTARDMLRQFAEGPLLRYKDDRDFPAVDGTSRLSPHLRFGTISTRTILAGVRKTVEKHPKASDQAESFVTELIWREFYRHILWYHPEVEHGAFKPAYNSLKWENNEDYFQAWCEGRTGYPLVDAAMRQLNTTGWMHNRLRMITATFLTKDLLVSWQWGERYFMQRLVDGDLAANNGGWQWSSSTGTDAQPYFRIFNPTSQMEKFDPERKFIARYAPEYLTGSHPQPIVDHNKQRAKALALFGRI